MMDKLGDMTASESEKKALGGKADQVTVLVNLQISYLCRVVVLSVLSLGREI